MWKWILSKILKRQYGSCVDLSNGEDFTVTTWWYRDKNGIVNIYKQEVTK
jgi:hypothetical protein